MAAYLSAFPHQVRTGELERGFSLGMYTVCTYETAGAMRLDFLRPIADVFVYVALLAWAAAFIGFVRKLASDLFPALNSR